MPRFTKYDVIALRRKLQEGETLKYHEVKLLNVMDAAERRGK